MTQPLSLFMRFNSLGSTPSNEIFGSMPVQRLVKDEVIFAPAKNPYEALNKAAERLSAGESVFTMDFIKTEQAA